MKKLTTIMITLIFIAVLAACAFTPDLNFLTTISPTATTPGIPRITQAPPVVVNGEDIAKTDLILTRIYETANPGVVSIVNLSSAGESSGSGWVYDSDGHIITNYHVVEGATSLEVDFPSGLKVEGTVIATDLDSDIAVIKVDVSPDQLVPLPLGDSDKLKIGQMVVAIGNPFRLTSTMTFGIISAKGRILDSIRTTADQTPTLLGTSSRLTHAINPGNSGGPLINLAGEVVGINRAIQTSGYTAQGEAVNTGIGFAISINIVKRVVPYLISQGCYYYPYLGISSSTRDLTLDEWEAVEPYANNRSIYHQVTPSGPAEKAGLGREQSYQIFRGCIAGGDIIIAVDGRPVNVYGDLISYIFNNRLPGDTITLTIIRDGAQKEVELTLGSRD